MNDGLNTSEKGICLFTVHLSDMDFGPEIMTVHIHFDEGFCVGSTVVDPMTPQDLHRHQLPVEAKNQREIRD